MIPPTLMEITQAQNRNDLVTTHETKYFVYSFTTLVLLKGTIPKRSKLREK
jgi:hypothetical protein